MEGIEEMNMTHERDKKKRMKEGIEGMNTAHER